MPKKRTRTRCYLCKKELALKQKHFFTLVYSPGMMSEKGKRVRLTLCKEDYAWAIRVPSAVDAIVFGRCKRDQEKE